MQAHWQTTLRGPVVGILTNQRVLIASADLDILSSSSTKFDRGLPSISFYLSLAYTPPPYRVMQSHLLSVLNNHFFGEHLTILYYRSMLWVGPALIFSSATAISMLGWDNKVRSILSTSFPRSGKIHLSYYTIQLCDTSSCWHAINMLQFCLLAQSVLN